MKLTHFIFISLVVLMATSYVFAMPRLRVDGRSIINDQNEVVLLRGFNLGGWFVLEDYMSPIDQNHSCQDSYCVMNKLNNRFGVDTQQSLMKAYQQTWIQEQDIANIKNSGYNAVRVPLWWGQFFALDNPTIDGFRSDAWDVLDDLIQWCEAYEVYVIFDLHGAIGSQSISETTGQANRNEFFSSNSYQSMTAWLWWQIANHYKAYNSVAGYDLLNEPDPRSDTSVAWTQSDTDAIINVYKWFYTSIRSVDDSHIIFIQGTFYNWNWDVLPAPSVNGWTNVVYTFHEYQWPTTNSVGNIENGVNAQVNDFNSHSSWNIPGYIGEWNGFEGYSTTFPYALNTFDNAGLHSTMWSYKAVNGACNVVAGSFWGEYCITNWPERPTLDTDSADAIASKWRNWATSAVFAKNTMLGI